MADELAEAFEQADLFENILRSEYQKIGHPELADGVQQWMEGDEVMVGIPRGVTGGSKNVELVKIGWAVERGALIDVTRDMQKHLWAMDIPAPATGDQIHIRARAPFEKAKQKFEAETQSWIGGKIDSVFDSLRGLF